MASDAEGVKLIVGLGNPGPEYASSRHNAGFMVLERLLSRVLPAGRFGESFTAESRVWTGRYRGRTLVLQQPWTFMNLSGQAVAPLSRRLGIAPAEILIVSDDLDLPVGRLRLRRGGADGGHNGLKSVIAELGSADFMRLRIGIGRPQGRDTADYVLSGFSGAEAETFAEALDRAAEAVKTLLACGMTAAMNRFNAPPAEKTAEEQA